ncbi:MAG TPA: hypothetical protein VFH39_04465, partial [Candidatus Saccharimonadales bacterium]|nr:hypothetical protein [Candidatus Saccharimonadales bacterium]
MSEAFAHEPDRRLVGGHLSLIVDAENDNDVVIGFHGEILRQSTPQSTVTERFAEFSRRNDINPQDVTPDTRHAFATTMHDFVFDDVTQHIRNKIGPEAPIIGVLPRELVEKRLSLFYEQRDPADSDTVRRGLAER